MFTIVVAWIAFSLYHNAVSSTISDILTVQIQSISPNFDLKTIDMLKGKNVITPMYDIDQASPSGSQSAETTSIPTPTVNSTQSAQIVPKT